MAEELFKSLQSNLSDAKSKLKSATESLQKLRGPPVHSLEPQDRKRTAVKRDSENGAGVNAASDSSGIPAKRPYGSQASVFQRLTMSANKQQEQPRPAVPLAEFQRARRAAIKEASATEDSEIRARNRRMFGVMLGTLKQFSQAEQDRERQESYQQRRQIEQRVEESVKREKEKMRQDLADLTGERKRRQIEIAALEAQLSLVESHNTWRRAAEQLRGSIRTLADAHPYRLYYRPRVFCDRAKRRRELGAKQIDSEIAEREQKLRQAVDRALAEAAESATAAAAAAAASSLANRTETEASSKERKLTADSSSNSRPEPVKRLLSSVAVVPQQSAQSASADTAGDES